VWYTHVRTSHQLALLMRLAGPAFGNMEGLVMTSSQSSASRLRLRNVCARAAAVNRVAKTRSKRANGGSIAGSLAVSGLSWQPNHTITRRTARITRYCHCPNYCFSILLFRVLIRFNSLFGVLSVLSSLQ